MFSLYSILKFIHISAVVFWVGGVGSMAFFVLRAGRSTSPSVLRDFMALSATFGQRVVGPSSGIALLAGIVMVITAKIGFMTLWIMWGFGGFALHLILGGTVLRRNGMELGRLAAASTVDSAALAAALKKQQTMALVYVLSMLSVIWAMVAKPT
jgi:uncharacterized membrane protein